jgi:mannose-6-phosphate isomerase-like protein (cupin superfamily)
MVIMAHLLIALKGVWEVNTPTMHHKDDVLRTDPWESALGADSAETITLGQTTSKLLPDSDIRKKFRRRTVKRTNKQSPPAVKGKILESIVLHPGERQEAQYHPNTAQLDFVVSGDARIGIQGQDDEVDMQYASEGEVAIIPMGCDHWIENMSETAPLLVLVLENEEA